MDEQANRRGEVMRSASEGMRRRVWANLWVVLLLAILGFLVIYPIMVGFTATSSPLLVNGYLLGDFGIVITVAAAVGAALVSRLVPPGGGKSVGAKTSPRSTRPHKRLSLPLKPTEVLCVRTFRILGPSGTSAEPVITRGIGHSVRSQGFTIGGSG